MDEEFDAAATTRRLLREAHTGALATISQNGGPYVSLVTVAPAADGAPVLLLSRLARHTGNIEADPRVALLLRDRAAGDPLTQARVTIAGRIARTDDPAARARFLARHQAAESYAGFADFSFWRIEPDAAHLVAGFGRIVDLHADQLRSDVDDAGELLAVEQQAIRHMNEDHADAVERYATRLLGEPPGRWRMVSLDPEGCDLMMDQRVRRLCFSHRITTPDALRKTLADLAKQARAE